MQAIEGFIPVQDGQNPLNKLISSVLRGALRSLLEGDQSLPQSAQENFAATLVLVDGPGVSGPQLIHYQGERAFFPNDLVSLFYLAGIYLLRKANAIGYDQYVERDILRMVRARDVDAANLLLDRITGTLSGPELPEGNLEIFARRRGRLDELLKAIGVNGTRCRQKIWDRPPYGRDAQFLSGDPGRTNQITANATAMLLTKIILGQVAGPEWSQEMLDLLRIEASEADGPQKKLYLVRDLPPVSKAWGQRTVGSRILHEVAAVQLPGEFRYVLVVLSYLGENYQSSLEPFGRKVAEGLGKGLLSSRV